MKASSWIILGGVAAAGVYLWSKYTSLKNAVRNLVISPHWDGSLDNMNVNWDGVTLPLAIDFGNRSSDEVEFRLQALDLYVKGSQLAYSKPGNNTVLIGAYGTTTLRGVRMFIPFTSLVMVLGGTIADWYSRSKDDRKGLWTSLLKSAEIKLTFEVNGFVQVPMTIGAGGLSLSGMAVKAEAREIEPYTKEVAALIPSGDYLLKEDAIVKDNVEPEETAEVILELARSHRWETRKLAEWLRRETVDESIQNLWDFVARHIKYVKDDVRNEQVRVPLRTLHDQKGDCDCYSTLVASVFENWGLDYVVRIVEYENRGYFQHVYVVAQVGGREFVCDPVNTECFAEKEWTRKKDFK